MFRQTLPLLFKTIVPQPRSFSIDGVKKFLKLTHTTAWKWDRIVILSLFPVMPISLFLQAPVTDSMLAMLTTFHIHQ